MVRSYHLHDSQKQSVNSLEYLVNPLHGKPPHRPRHCQTRGLPPRQYRFHDLWREECHAQQPADVGRVDVLGLGDLIKGLIAAWC